MKTPINLSYPARWLITASLLLAALIVLHSSTLLARVQMTRNSVLKNTESIYVPSINQSKLLYLGYSQAAADVSWIRSLNYFARHFMTDRKYPHLINFVDQTIELDPKFKSVYWWAGSSLLYGRLRTNEVVMEANQYYERALKAFPNDHESAYRLGMNYHAELQSDDPKEKAQFRKKALFYLEFAASMPDAPRRIGELVAALNIKYGADELALQYLTDLYIRTTDPKELKRLERRMEALNKNVDADARREVFKVFRTEWMDSLPYGSDVLFGLVQKQTQRPRLSWRANLSLRHHKHEIDTPVEEEQ
jgi:hypothetical protein